MIVDPAALAFCKAVIGKPHSRKGRGPDAYSCQGLTVACQREVFGRVLEIVDVDEDSPMAVARAAQRYLSSCDWPAVVQPRHGDVVFMSRRDHPNHVGTYLDLDRGGILHATVEDGVCFDPLSIIPFKGWVGLIFHRPQGAQP